MYLTVKQTEQTYALLLKVSLRLKVFEMNDNSISIKVMMVIIMILIKESLKYFGLHLIY